MRRALAIVLVLCMAPVASMVDSQNNHLSHLETLPEPLLSYGVNTQNFTFSNTIIQSGYNTSVTALSYNSDGKLSFGGQVCGMFPAEYYARNQPTCTYESSNGSNSHTGYQPAIFGDVNRNGTIANTEIINSSLGGDRIDAILHLSNGDHLISGWYCWGNSAQPGSCEISKDGITSTAYEGDDAFIARVDQNGTWLWSITMGGASWDTTHSLAEGPNGELFALTSFCVNAGNSCQVNLAGTGVNTTNGADDLIIMEISPTGTIQWTQQMGSSESDHAPEASVYRLSKKGIVATDDGGVIVGGSSCEQSGTCDFYIGDLTLDNGSDGFLGKFDGDGDLIWAQQVGGNAVDYLQSMAKIDEHRIVVGGNHYSQTFSAGSKSIINSGSSDAWWGIFNHTAYLWEGLWGSTDSADSFVHSVDVDAKGNIILGASGCWMNSNCNVQIAGLSQSNLTKSGFVASVDQNGTGNWLLPIVSSNGDSSPVNALTTFENGDIAAASRLCVSNTICVGSVGNTGFATANRYSVIVQIHQDTDLDGIYDDTDNCRFGISEWTSNNTTDFDNDGCRDVDEDLDDDNDGFYDIEDACSKQVGNSSLDRKGCLDSDGDGWSDPDTGWSLNDGADAFPNNATQWSDQDEDGYGDNHYYDMDPNTGLFVNQSGDGSPLDPEQWSDMDGDGYGDNDQSGSHYDDCPYTYGLSYENERFGCVDTDGDGWANEDDDYPFDGTQWSDQDEDGYGDNPSGTTPDACPTTYGTSTIIGNLGCPDIDGDGWPDSEDAFPNDSSQWNDTDGDGFGDEPMGVDGDNCVNTPGNSTLGLLGCIDADGDGWADSEDDLPGTPSQWQDSDSDGYGDNQDGINPDGCPTQAGTSYIDVYGCADYDSDGWSGQTDVFPFDSTQWMDTDDDGYGDNATGDYADNCPTIPNGVDQDNQADYDLDGDGDACDTDDDGDSILDSDDMCPQGITDWTSTSLTDFDQDGCLDNTEDDDDDNDGIMDTSDLCQKSNELFNSSSLNDHDIDGCLDSNEEDPDDDNDGVVDIKDMCPKGESNWVSTLSADWDGDGCKDDVEDSDDDNDGLEDDLDSCPTGLSQWEDQRGELDLDMDGCLDGRESPLQQGSGAVDEQYYLDLIANQSQVEERTFVEALAAGDLDAVGLVFAALLPIVGIGTTLAFRVRKGAFIRSLERTVQMALTIEDLDQAKKDIRRAAKNDQISTNRYELMMDDLNDRRETLLEEKNNAKKNRSKGPPKKSPPKRTPLEATPEPEPEPVPAEEEYFTPPEDQITTGDDGYRYWEDQNGQWWVEMDGEWTQWG
ncbi:MAG: hypothetical protein CMB13_03635 [Euryarchaeota archaeon]|nr:hypothetical protein [Euryarchaeota archaeon]